MIIELQNFSTGHKTEIQNIINKLSLKTDENKKYLFFWISESNEVERIKLRKHVNNGENVILFSDNKDNALLAWQSNSLGFILFPLIEREIIQLIIKLKEQTVENPYKNKFTIKQQDGTHQIDCNAITLIEAKGNFSIIHFSNGKKWTLTLQLGELEKKIVAIPYLVRFGKSLIINIKRLTSIRKNTISLIYDSEIKLLTFTYRFCLAVKNYLLWKTYI